MAVKNDSATLARAIRELGINVPIYTTRVVGGRLELYCYGGQLLYWPARAPTRAACTASTQKGHPCRNPALDGTDPLRCRTHNV